MAGPPRGEWIQLLGALYDRKIYAFEVETTAQQDEALIETFNDKTNRSHFNLFFHNCADFARVVLDFYYPGSVRRSYTADLGMTTPKQLAKNLVRYAEPPRADGAGDLCPATSGREYSAQRQVDGVAEAVLRKKYVIPIAFLQPYCAAGFAVTYFTGGRFNPSRNAVPLERADLVASLFDTHEPTREQAPARRSLNQAAKEGGSASPVSDSAYMSAATETVPAD